MTRRKRRSSRRSRDTFQKTQNVHETHIKRDHGFGGCVYGFGGFEGFRGFSGLGEFGGFDVFGVFDGFGF